MLYVQWYLEEKCPMAVDSPSDQTNGNDIRLELKLELTEVQHPWKFVQLFHFHCSAHGFTDQPDTKIHANKTCFNAGTFAYLHNIITCYLWDLWAGEIWKQWVPIIQYKLIFFSARCLCAWLHCHLAKAAYCSRSSLSERMDSLASLTSCCNEKSSIIFHGLFLGVSGRVSSFCLSSFFFFLYRETKIKKKS